MDPAPSSWIHQHSLVSRSRVLTPSLKLVAPTFFRTQSVAQPVAQSVTSTFFCTQSVAQAVAQFIAPTFFRTQLLIQLLAEPLVAQPVARTPSIPSITAVGLKDSPINLPRLPVIELDDASDHQRDSPDDAASLMVSSPFNPPLSPSLVVA
ncbi:hypothetical protein L226DRAFT_574284 [Lentinus tigrinus ALCF2SS1-7]|uniref:uncharacterized protein n=1 Tax=Lentinus tigrinus ALCF2SS1-7 TaxID=1328758 RepID=UPI001165D87D|nr:hypothetical protein L226DRAFT_574284 [Lentinus tigrinus ALCF2SS1-7]